MNRQKKEIIIINYTGRRGGGALDALEMAKALVDKGQSVVPIISKSIENLDEWKKIKFEELLTINTYSSMFKFFINTFLFRFVNQKMIKALKEKYDVKVVYSPMICFWTGIINSYFKTSLKVIVVHDPIHHSGTNRFADFFLDKPYKRADFLIVHSKKFVQYTEKKYKKKTYYLPLGSHDYYFKLYSSNQNKKTQVNYKREEMNFLFFGRIDDYKGIDVLSEAFQLIERKYGNFSHLYIVGNGNLEKYSAGLNTLNNLTIINEWIPDSEVGCFFQSDELVCVCPYKDATQSGIVLTAYSFGVPVIATDTGGLNEQVFDGFTGFLIPPSNSVALAEAMEKFILKKGIIAQMKNNIATYIDGISWESSALELISYINKELKKRQSS